MLSVCSSMEVKIVDDLFSKEYTGKFLLHLYAYFRKKRHVRQILHTLTYNVEKYKKVTFL